METKDWYFYPGVGWLTQPYRGRVAETPTGKWQAYNRLGYIIDGPQISLDQARSLVDKAANLMKERR